MSDENTVIEVHIDVSEITKLINAIPEMDNIMYSEMRAAMDESGEMLSLAIAPLTPVNYGLLRSAIQWPKGYEATGLDVDTLRGVIGAGELQSESGTATSVYVKYVEEGTSPHWAPIAPLKLYAIRKFGDEKAAYGIRAKIAKSGTKGAHMFKEGWEASKSKIEKIWQGVPQKAIDKFERLV